MIVKLSKTLKTKWGICKNHLTTDLEEFKSKHTETNYIILNGEKLKAISPKIRNKTRVSTFTTIIQHSSESPSHSNQRRKRNKKNPDWKRRNKALTACR